MPVSLTGTPASPTTLDTTPADPPLNLVGQAESGGTILFATEAEAFDGLYPPFYPGTAVFPGSGTNLGSIPATPLTLTGDPA